MIDKNSLQENEIINIELLKKLQVLKKKEKKLLKILGNGELNSKNSIECNKITISAQKKLEKLGIEIKIN